MKILVVRFSSLGDLILTTGVLYAFKIQFPDAHITLMTYKEYESLLKKVSFIDEILTVDRHEGFGGYLKFIMSHVFFFDWVIDLHGSLRSRLILLFKPFRYLKYKKKSFSRRLYVKFRILKGSLSKHVTERYADPFVKQFGLKYKNLEDLRPRLFEQQIFPSRGQIVVHPFASKRTKEWPYFKELVLQLREQGYSVSVLGHGNFEVPEGIQDLVGKTDLPQMLDEISKADLLITTDSGPMHAGVAFGRKVLALFGPTTKEFGFAPQFQKVHILEVNGLACRPCHVHGLNQCPKGHFKCMKDISLKAALVAVKTIMKQQEQHI